MIPGRTDWTGRTGGNFEESIHEQIRTAIFSSLVSSVLDVFSRYFLRFPAVFAMFCYASCMFFCVLLRFCYDLLCCFLMFCYALLCFSIVCNVFAMFCYCPKAGFCSVYPRLPGWQDATDGQTDGTCSSVCRWRRGWLRRWSFARRHLRSLL